MPTLFLTLTNFYVFVCKVTDTSYTAPEIMTFKAPLNHLPFLISLFHRKHESGLT